MADPLRRVVASGVCRPVPGTVGVGGRSERVFAKTMAVTRADPDRRVGAIPAGRLVLLRNAGIEDSALYSAGLTLVAPEASIDRTLRTYWFREGERPLRRAMGRVRDARGGLRGAAKLRDAVLAMPGIQAIPFLAMALHEPVAGGDVAPAVAALAQTSTPAASVPLADLAILQGTPQETVQTALQALTGQRFETGEQCRLWLLGPALLFLRGEEPTAPAGEQ